MSVTADPTTTDAADGSQVLRRTLRRLASGVTVITLPGPTGFTATSFTSVSLDPALVSFYLGLNSSALDAVRDADRFAVHVLGAEHAGVARRFARRGIDRFDGSRWREAPDGLPVLDGVPAWLSARIVQRQEIGDHLLVVGEVESGGGHAQGPALVHHDGDFATAVRL